MKISTNKEIANLVRQLLGEGWSCEPGKKHWKLRRPDGAGPLSVPGSPSCKRAYENFKHDVRRLLLK